MSLREFSSIERAVRRYLHGRKEVQAAYIFGSVAIGVARPDSDIDIALLIDESVPSPRMSKYRLGLIAELQSVLHRSDVDVVLLNQATPLLAHRVLSRGKLIFERSALARVRFQVQTARRYSDLIPMFETHIRYLKKSVREGRIVG